MKVHHVRHLNFRQLLYFHETVRLGTVTAAARAMHVSQPTVSSQLRALEEALEVPLLERAGRRIRPTAQGRAVARYAAEMFDTAHEMLVALQRLEHAGDTLDVGVADVVPQPLAMALLGDLGVRLRVEKGHPTELLDHLGAHLLHAVVTDAPTNDPVRHVRYHNHLLGTSAIAVLHPAVPDDGRPLSLQLEGRPVVLPTSGTVLRRTLDAWADRHGVDWDVVGAFEDPEMLARHGMRCGAAVPVLAVVAQDYLDRFGGYHLGCLDADVRLYAVTTERRVRHEALRALTTTRWGQVFGTDEAHEASASRRTG